MLIFWLVAALLAGSPANAQEMEYGEAEYLLSCAECHGSYGRGDGMLAHHFGFTAPDLTRLRERNDGEFPYIRVFEMIYGQHSGPRDPSRVMPSFGAEYSERDELQYGPEIGGALTERRIQALTRYVESLQQ